MAFHNLKTKMFCLSDFLAHTTKPDDLNAVGLNRNLQIIQDEKKQNSFCLENEQSDFGNLGKCGHE